MVKKAAGTWQEYLEQNQERFVQELIEFLRIPSISALPEHAPDVRRAAEWIRDRMRAAGLENVDLPPTQGTPVGYGEWLHAPGKPTALIYGHFDTQPVDPLEPWKTPPFEPDVRDGRIYARGASDDKGNLLVPVLAIEALLATEHALPINVKCLFEGGEESGSPGLDDLIAKRSQQLACDLALNADVTQWSETAPALLLGLRGISGLQIHVQGPNSDLHSGTFGGAVQNPIHALATILASMRSPEGRISVEGFYDQVRELSAAERAEIARVPLDEDKLKRDLDVDALFGEPGYGTLEREWVRPTLEVNGITGGFQGPGGKTIVPSWAVAKITCRLVPNQDPQAVVDAVRAHVLAHTPPGVRVTVYGGGGAKPYEIPADHWGNLAAARALRSVYGQDPYATRMGGSVPVCTTFQELLGVYSVGYGFGLEDENIHAPNEFFRLSSYARGQQAYVRLFQELAAGEGA
ncbi:MAG: dipeptidase [Chloroflexi bacterium]|nr:dipeptidase [Chloroflexota bacterium]